MLEFFQPLGRTMIVNTHAGGWFPPHKDNPQLTRSTFRIVAFLSRATQHDAYEWEMAGQKWPITPGKAYYVDTRKTHRTHSWFNNSLQAEFPKNLCLLQFASFKAKTKHQVP